MSIDRRVRVVIADDEAIARAGLRRMLGAFDWIDVIGEAAHGPAALEAIERLRPELVFLDIQMPGLLGTEVLARLTQTPFAVFTTAYAEHAVTAFELGALDYLLKPFGAARLAATLDRVRAALAESVADTPAADTPTDRLGEVLGEGPLQRLFIRQGSAIVPLPVANVRWFEADGDYVIAHVERGRHVLSLPLARLESQLDPTRFTRIHRARVVNLDHVLAFRSHGKGGMVAELRGGEMLAVSRARAQELRRLGV
jgi:two-component system LytT family response regulator